MNPDRAQARADDLAGRLAARMTELDREEQLAALPPVVVGAAPVVPAGLLARLGGQPTRGSDCLRPRTQGGRARAVDAVVAAEEALGYDVAVMPPSNPGFDLRSEGPTGDLRFAEVKGRIVGADQFMVTATRSSMP